MSPTAPLSSRRLLFRSGELRRGPHSLELRPADAGWQFSGLTVITLAAGETYSVGTDGVESGVLPLRGAASVEVDGESYAVERHGSVFDGAADFVYVPLGSTARIVSTTGGEYALPSSRATRRLRAAHVPASAVPVVQRGAGNCARTVRNFCGPDVVEADKLIAVEIVTPAGHWSSYPPHRHDREADDELPLEEVYYFRTRDPHGFGLHAVYDPHPAGSIDANVSMVQDGDLVVVPRAFHGPTVAGPGYDLYYLNVLAGPAPVRELRFCDDPAHAGIRDSWT